jgi:molybdopterin converting factor subunit 1
MVQIRLFARARDLAGTDTIEIELPRGATVGDLRRELGQRYSRLAPLLARSALAVNDELTDDALVLPANADVALLPPVSGGTMQYEPETYEGPRPSLTLPARNVRGARRGAHRERRRS